MNKTLILTITSILLATILLSCNFHHQSPIPEIVPDEGHGSLIGSLSLSSVLTSGETQYVYAAKYISITQNEGLYLYDLMNGLESIVDENGKFRFENIPEGLYVLSIGRFPEEAVRILDDNYQVRVVEVKSGEINHLSEIFFSN
jgi:hypothetical protein